VPSLLFSCTVTVTVTVVVYCVVGNCVSTVDAYHAKGVSNSQIRVSPYDIRGHNYDVSEVDYVSVVSTETLRRYNVVEHCKYLRSYLILSYLILSYLILSY